jgi:hypothetical protein
MDTKIGVFWSVKSTDLVFTIFSIHIPLTQSLNLTARIVVAGYLNIVSKGTFFTGRL